MTLVEVLITLTILIGLMGSSVSFINRRDNHIKKELRQLKALNRQLDYQARLRGKVWRLAINLEKNTYYVEKKLNKVDQNSLVNNPFDKDKDKDSKDSNITNHKKEDSKTADNFVIDKNFFEKPQTLPKKFVFESIELSYQKKSITDGSTYIYYLPEGQLSSALVLIKYKKSYRSLFFNRLTGELTMFLGKKTLTDLTK